jgi:hypothetical protein
VDIQSYSYGDALGCGIKEIFLVREREFQEKSIREDTYHTGMITWKKKCTFDIHGITSHATIGCTT